MTYKGYDAVVGFDEEAGLFTGEVIGTRDVITFQGTSVAELTRAFKDSVDDYLDFCAARKERPEKPYSGAFLVRMPEDLHRHLAGAARQERKSLNAYVVERLQAVPALPDRTRRAKSG